MSRRDEIKERIEFNLKLAFALTGRDNAQRRKQVIGWNADLRREMAGMVADERE